MKTAFEKRSESYFLKLGEAQRWVRKHPLDRVSTLVMRQALQDRGIKQLYSSLCAAGRDSIARIVVDRFGLPLTKASVLGLAYPNYTPKCAVCGARVYRMSTGFCSDSCRRKSQAEKMSRITRDARSKETRAQKENRAAAAQRTWLSKYGVVHPSKRAEYKEHLRSVYHNRSEKDKNRIRKQTIATCKIRYGGANPMDNRSVQIRAANGVRAAYAQRNDSIQEVRRKNFLLRYGHGIEHQMHLPEVRAKVNRMRTKSIRLGGVTMSYQGYEDHVLHYLHDSGFRVTTSCRGIAYTIAGVKHMYYPDILAYRKDDRRLIEVKSTYTFRWTRSNTPQKFFAGTSWAAENEADYYIVVVIPCENRMLVIKNPTSPSHLRIATAHGIAIKRSMNFGGRKPKDSK